MLGFKMALTSAQTRMLMVLYASDYRNADGLLIPNYQSPDFVTTGNCLIRRGLVCHSMQQSPTWQITEQGAAIAAMIARDARELVELADIAEKKKKRAVKVRRA